MSGLLGPLALIVVFTVLIVVIRLVHLRRDGGGWGASRGRKESDSNDG
ncbi:hypothetical protein [Amycolatopsis sp. NPDC102389]